jgi:hypothetical protein
MAHVSNNDAEKTRGLRVDLKFDECEKVSRVWFWLIGFSEEKIAFAENGIQGNI